MEETMGEEKKVARKKLKSAKVLGKFMADYYHELDRASKTGKKKIAWCTSVGPAEILRAMGFVIYFPETHSAMLGSTRMASDLIPKANAIGYSPDICSYLTADIGAYLEGVTPLSKAFEGITAVPKPDLLVFNTNQCRDVQDWFTWYGREYNAPVIGVHTHRGVGKITESHITSITRQLEALIEPLEKISDRKFEIKDLKKIVALSRECSNLWKKVLDTASAVPAPLTFFDGTTLMGAAVVGRGTSAANDCYRILLAELEERVLNKVGVIEDEQFRIYWEGMPVWGRLGIHFQLFAGLKANVLASTYCNSWIFSDLDPTDPFTSMARAYTTLFIVRSDAYKEKYIKKMLDFFKVDGIVYHDAKTCPNNSNCRYGMPQRIEKETGLPSLVINGDLNDLRLLSDEQTRTNVEAFIELLEENK
ncbi:MAG: 2-hydroxyacyl-CoA dehydratase family protein [Desulfobacterales bacterium]|jgi:benzoyl-CoA reductase/2-hydroxyglutaryl-CoA dehydratase subunit BcrC/BadD/HgdB|nr:2-hydroxyacyl-CoA dehydratase family protein [Desulfobacterales bacterium]MDP6683773.1 2-hydroxyacyl-CoA dehydratase family protein [Desulfobacterales bacterium]MDP6806162.1 2-hydroxyacyl-CoA dehydratase family protein [Desulfobacterales bacterium]|tara:strand:- start:54026 stop:55285 length:1260 start_codon:yes stop_codon:yes gene_type:complete